MVIWTTTLRPVEEPIRFGDPHIIDAGIPMMHDAFGVKLPVLIAVGAIPLTGIVVVLVGKSQVFPFRLRNSRRKKPSVGGCTSINSP
jgi:hypothetical protein